VLEPETATPIHMCCRSNDKVLFEVSGCLDRCLSWCFRPQLQSWQRLIQFHCGGACFGNYIMIVETLAELSMRDDLGIADVQVGLK
jgi:hypothetical protein